MRYLDLWKTSHCPVGEKCAFCGATPKTDSGLLRVETYAAGFLGIACMTLCDQCYATDTPNRMPLGVWPAAQAAARHRQHLGLTQEQADALYQEGL